MYTDICPMIALGTREAVTFRSSVFEPPGSITQGTSFMTAHVQELCALDRDRVVCQISEGILQGERTSRGEITERFDGGIDQDSPATRVR